MSLNFFILILIISSVLSFVLTIFIWRRRKVLGTPSLGGLLICIAVWTLAAAMEMVVPTLQQKMVFVNIYYVCVMLLPVWFFLFTAEYTELIGKISLRIRISLWILPFISIILLITNRFHNLFFSKISLEYIGSMVNAKLEYNFWWWIHTTYSYILIVAGIFLLVQMLFNCTLQQRAQIRILLIASSIPMIANFFFISGYKPLSFIDLTSVAFAITGILFFWGMHSNKLFSVKPIALDALFANLPDGIVLLDLNNVIVDINDAAVKLLDVERKSAINESIDNIFPLFHELKGQKTSTFREVVYNGKIFDITFSPMISQTDKISGLLLIIRDVSERKQAESDLKSTRDRFELAILAAGLDPWENNLVTGKREGGDKIYRELGYKPDETPQSIEEIFKLVHPDDLPLVKMRINNHLVGKTELYTSDYRVRDKKGNYHWVANYGKIVERDPDGNAIRFIGLTLNIDERKKIEEKFKKQNDELLKANAEKDKFFSIIAHDLRGPFQGFIGLTELMAESITQMSKEEVQDISQTLQGTAKNLYELLDNLLNWAMVKRGHKRFNVEKVNLYGLVSAVIEMIQHQIKNKDHIVSNSIDKDVMVFADRETLKTVMRNLISNAIKFTPRGGSITLSNTDRKNGFVEVSVLDTGIGMTPDIKDNLFKLTKKVSRPGTEDEPSTGLGLILCKELIEKHGGVIWVESNPGEGSNFRFTLPKTE